MWGSRKVISHVPAAASLFLSHDQTKEDEQSMPQIMLKHPLRLSKKIQKRQNHVKISETTGARQALVSIP
jgi:hypothetical protein